MSRRVWKLCVVKVHVSLIYNKLFNHQSIWKWVNSADVSIIHHLDGTQLVMLSCCCWCHYVPGPLGPITHVTIVTTGHQSAHHPPSELWPLPLHTGTLQGTSGNIKQLSATLLWTNIISSFNCILRRPCIRFHHAWIEIKIVEILRTIDGIFWKCSASNLEGKGYMKYHDAMQCPTSVHYTK